MEFDNNSPIYIQIVELFKNRIASGKYAPGDRVDSVRELALSMGVNPNTMQRAMSELERDGYLRSERTSGRFITANTELIAVLKQEKRGEVIEKFVREMLDLGYGPEQLPQLLSDALQTKDAV